MSRNDILDDDDDFGDLSFELLDFVVSEVRGRGVANDPLLPQGNLVPIFLRSSI